MPLINRQNNKAGKFACGFIFMSFVAPFLGHGVCADIVVGVHVSLSSPKWPIMCRWGR